MTHLIVEENSKVAGDYALKAKKKKTVIVSELPNNSSLIINF